MITSLAVRNLSRNSRRSLFTIAAIAVGFVAINLFGGYIVNVFAGIKISAIHGESLGHITIAKRGYFSEGAMNKAAYVFTGEELESLTEIIHEHPSVVIAAPRLTLNGLLSNGDVSTIFVASAIDPSQQRMLKGVSASESLPTILPEDSQWDAIIASDLAHALHIEEGSDAVLFTPTLAGQANATDIRIHSIVNTGNAATNDKMIDLPLEVARTLLDTQGAEKITLLLDDETSMGEIIKSISRDASAAGFDIEVKTWQELSAFYTQVRNMLSMIFLFVFAVVLVIVVMSIMNTMSMIVVERTREIGTLRSLGVQRSVIRRLFTMEGLLLSVAACAIGAVITFVVAALINRSGFTYVPPSNSEPVMLRVSVGPIFMVGSLVLLCAMSMLFSLVPSSRAAKLTVSDALKHV